MCKMRQLGFLSRMAAFNSIDRLNLPLQITPGTSSISSMSLVLHTFSIYRSLNSTQVPIYA